MINKGVNMDIFFLDEQMEPVIVYFRGLSLTIYRENKTEVCWRNEKLENLMFKHWNVIGKV